ncbi:MAG: helix-turn-helix transcriptional regulator [bacterium]
MDKIKLGNYIKNKREELNLSQDELSVKLNVELSVVSSWENGEVLPELNIIVALANSLNISVDELLTQKVIEKEIVYQNHKYTLPLVIILIVIFILGIVFMTTEYI